MARSTARTQTSRSTTEAPADRETAAGASRSRVPADSSALKIVKWIARHGIEGVSPLSSALDLADEYLIDQSYPDDESRIDALITWECSKNFGSGFISGLGGVLTMPVAVASSLGASWIIQARMAAAIARIHGHDLAEPRIRTLVLLSLMGSCAPEVARSAGVDLDKKLTKAALRKLSAPKLARIDECIGVRLLAKTGQQGVVKLVKLVPIVGGVIGGSFDAATCRSVGQQARNLFRPAVG